MLIRLFQTLGSQLKNKRLLSTSTTKLPSFQSNRESLFIGDSVIPFVWLLDHCQCPKCIHQQTHQKLHSSGSIDVERQPILKYIDDTNLHVQWSPTHASSYSLAFLKKHAQPPAHSSGRTSDSSLNPFQKSGNVNNDSPFQKSGNVNNNSPFQKSANANNNSPFLDKTLHWTKATLDHSFIPYSLFQTPQGFKQTLEKLDRQGIAFIQDVPLDPSKVEEIAVNFGSIMNTFYGMSWDVKSCISSNNIASTDLYLGLHMDLMYSSLTTFSH